MSTHEAPQQRFEPAASPRRALISRASRRTASRKHVRIVRWPLPASTKHAHLPVAPGFSERFETSTRAARMAPLKTLPPSSSPTEPSSPALTPNPRDKPRAVFAADPPALVETETSAPAASSFESSDARVEGSTRSDPPSSPPPMARRFRRRKSEDTGGPRWSTTAMGCRPCLGRTPRPRASRGHRHGGRRARMDHSEARCVSGWSFRQLEGARAASLFARAKRRCANSSAGRRPNALGSRALVHQTLPRTSR